jgi:pyruvate carboxylase
MRLSVLNMISGKMRQPDSEWTEFFKEKVKDTKPFWERRDELEKEDIEAEFKEWKRNKVIENILKDDEKRIS